MLIIRLAAKPPRRRRPLSSNVRAHRNAFTTQSAGNAKQRNTEMPHALVLADRLRLSGGYDYEPRWLPHDQNYMGPVVAFIPGQNSDPAVVVKLDKPITVDGITGEVLVLELRYAGASWKETETVHVELCPFFPESKSWQLREKGKWVESHATYHRA
jgi:hypothetical protein